MPGGRERKGPKHKKGVGKTSGPRSFLSAGSIRYERTKGRLKARARELGLNHTTVVMGGKATKDKFSCKECGQECMTAKDYRQHEKSQRHIEAIDEIGEEGLREVIAKRFEEEFDRKLRSLNTVQLTSVKVVIDMMAESMLHEPVEKTKWKSLRNFVKYMDESSKYEIQVKDGIPQVRLLFGSVKKRKAKTGLTAEEINERKIQEQIKRAKLEEASSGRAEPDKPKELPTDRPLAKISFSLGGAKQSEPPLPTKATVEAKPTSPQWIMQGIVVKYTQKKGPYAVFRGQKASVLLVAEEDGGAELRFADGTIVQGIPQKDVQTVIPAIGKHVMLLEGANRGRLAELVSLEQKKFSVTVRLLNGEQKGELISDVKYEVFSKVAKAK